MVEWRVFFVCLWLYEFVIFEVFSYINVCLFVLIFIGRVIKLNNVVIVNKIMLVNNNCGKGFNSKILVSNNYVIYWEVNEMIGISLLCSVKGV